MEKINFVNGQEPAINDTNLNAIQDNVENAINEVQESVNELKETILYENASGTNATSITMSETLANYKTVEVIYGYETVRTSVKVPKGAALPLFLSRAGYFQNSYYGVRQNTTSISFNGTTATKAVGYTFDFKTDGTIAFSDTINEIYIYKIVGYKE